MSKKNYLSLFLISGLLLFINPYSFAQVEGISQRVPKHPCSRARPAWRAMNSIFPLKEALDKGPVVVYFYPSAYTGGCDLEAHTFAEMKDKFTAAGSDHYRCIGR
jgi:hypothetical protein